MSRYLISATLLLALGTLSSVLVGSAAPVAETGQIVLAEQSDALLNDSPIITPETDYDPDVKRVVTVMVTAYSSTVRQTDSTPFITASGTTVRPGVVAANWLPIGTKVRIPKLFGDRVFVVEDRMHRRNDHKLDVWLESETEAFNFGVHNAEVEVL
ncbi:MAG: hypothetical protein COT88_00075 [Candidatus Colwellbacteria bacterium CG10_big_fil_rev_8_21_14_0_10_41_28]|uniref:3D domain-containing protein n=1 Tax=Candidatus Colwellbacteria bacterium CG10_big_fil_rev_8_21_14_0_10_41_28 TaxID=1974539 RepID=A0A2H0VI00_9BACT|nr:MAG: hypothetical protein COT88_00075 [Candidatus Colwellbacteria bacterium CG10_big_fil_rev_8_21_14_0_10_41_28]